MSEDKVVHVRFSEPVLGDRDHYFGSLQAIYQEFTDAEIGCKIQNLYNFGIKPGKPFENKHCTIKVKSRVHKRRK